MIDNVPADEIVSPPRPTFGQLAFAVNRGKWAGVIIMAITILATTLIFQAIDFKYRASVTVGPVQQETGLSQNLSGLASLAGVNLQRSQATSPFVLYLQVLHSRDIADWVQHNHPIMVRLFPARWDASSQTWRVPKNLAADVVRSVKGMIGMGTAENAEPSVAEVEKLLGDKLSIVENRRDSLADLSFADKDPKFAVDFLRNLSGAADNLISRSRSRSSKSPEHLSQPPARHRAGCRVAPCLGRGTGRAGKTADARPVRSRLRRRADRWNYR